MNAESTGFVINFPDLTEITGSFTVSNNVAGTVELYFPALTSIGTSMAMSSNGDLQAAEFPALVSTGQGITIQSNTGLATLQFPSLTTVTTGAVTIQSNVDLDVLELNGGLSILQSSGSLNIRTMTLTTLDINNLVYIGGRLEITSIEGGPIDMLLDDVTNLGRIQMGSSPAIRNFRAPLVTSLNTGSSQGWQFQTMNSLETIEMPAVTIINSASNVQNAPELHTIDMRALQTAEGANFLIFTCHKLVNLYFNDWTIMGGTSLLFRLHTMNLLASVEWPAAHEAEFHTLRLLNLPALTTLGRRTIDGDPHRNENWHNVRVNTQLDLGNNGDTGNNPIGVCMDECTRFATITETPSTGSVMRCTTMGTEHCVDDLDDNNVANVGECVCGPYACGIDPDCGCYDEDCPDYPCDVSTCVDLGGGSYECQNTSLVNCSDGNACTADSCDESMGGCQHANTTTACDDADPCTVDDVCAGGECAGAPKNCSDGDVCTDDTCDAETGDCLHANNTVPCDDANPCTLNDTCASGWCFGASKDCTGEGKCRSWLCDTDTGECYFVYHEINTPCEDGDLCTLGDVCSGAPFRGVCLSGVLNTCSDGNPCTIDACESESGDCLYANNTAVCDDADPCTVDDVCVGGVCVGAPKNCSDGDMCTDDECEVGTGECLHTNNTVACDDADPCTVDDVCWSGMCGGFAKNCSDGNGCTDDACEAESGECLHSNNTALCDDFSLCTLDDACVGGVCTGTPVDCNDDMVCTDDICDPETGLCGYVLNTAPCDDGDACTVSDACAIGMCVGVPRNCSDGNACTDDGCDGLLGDCVSVNNMLPCDQPDPCLVGGCLGGMCVGTPKDCSDGNVCTDDSCEPITGECLHANNTVACDDADPCTLNDDVCVGGECVGTPKNCSDGNACTDDACDADTGECLHTSNTVVCDDNDLCTLDDVCTDGACSGAQKNCSDGNVCTEDMCEFGTGVCLHANATVACDDTDPCTVSDVCTDGLCAGVSKNCSDGNACTEDACEPSTGDCLHTDITAACDDNDICTLDDVCDGGECIGTPRNCSDGNPCTDDACDADTGECVHANTTAACDDGVPCTVDDVCVDGVCTSTPKNCSDGNACTDDVCDAETGACVYINTTAACDDADPCTVGDMCVDGVCVHTPKNCSDGNACTDDACDADTGECVHVNTTAVCDDGIPCTVDDVCLDGVCIATPKNCSDGNACTDDACEPSTGDCQYTDVTAACDDNDRCTLDDVCDGGECIGTPRNCSDGNACTDDVCAADTGECVHVNTTAACDDGVPCTINDVCIDGVCTSTPKDCSDGSECTTDTCDPVTGMCVYAGCDDGNPCTIDACHPQADLCIHTPVNTEFALVEVEFGVSAERRFQCSGNLTECTPPTSTDVDVGWIYYNETTDVFQQLYEYHVTFNSTDIDASDMCVAVDGPPILAVVQRYLLVEDDGVFEMRVDSYAPPWAPIVPADTESLSELPFTWLTSRVINVMDTGFVIAIPLAPNITEALERMVSGTGMLTLRFYQQLYGPGINASAFLSIGTAENEQPASLIVAYNITCKDRCGRCASHPHNATDTLWYYVTDCLDVCGVPYGNGTTCNAGDPCVPGFRTCAPGLYCVDFVCCTSPCDGLCERCDLEPGGTCSNVSLGEDPDLECTVDDTCNHAECDGAGQCHAVDDDVTCQMATCSAAVFTPTATCTGVYGEPCPVSSAPCPKSLACASATACRTSCSTASHCAQPSLQYCAAQAGGVGTDGCFPKLPVPSPCVANTQCLSGTCKNGVCCSTSCAGPCNECHVVPGTCTPKVCDDSSDCTADSCDAGTGLCINELVLPCDDGFACTVGDSCATGTCVGTPVDCDDGNLCTTDQCVEEHGCRSVLVDCADDDDCTHDQCNPITGACENTPIDNCESSFADLSTDSRAKYMYDVFILLSLVVSVCGCCCYLVGVVADRERRRRRGIKPVPQEPVPGAPATHRTTTYNGGRYRALEAASDDSELQVVDRRGERDVFRDLQATRRSRNTRARDQPYRPASHTGDDIGYDSVSVSMFADAAPHAPSGGSGDRSEWNGAWELGV